MGWKSGEDGVSDAIRREKARNDAIKRAQARRDRDAKMPHGSSMMKAMDTKARTEFRRRSASKYQPISPLKVKSKK